MLWTVTAILVMLWLLALIGGVVHHSIHWLLVIAAIASIFQLTAPAAGLRFNASRRPVRAKTRTVVKLLSSN